MYNPRSFIRVLGLSLCDNEREYFISLSPNEANIISDHAWQHVTDWYSHVRHVFPIEINEITALLFLEAMSKFIIKKYPSIKDIKLSVDSMWIKYLANFKLISAIRGLDISNNTLKDSNLELLMKSQYYQYLGSLNLSFNKITNDGVSSLIAVNGC